MSNDALSASLHAPPVGASPVAATDRKGVAPTRPPRDLRLDLFRGIALWLIFLDHIPSNIVSRFTLRNFGFSDATEIFVFISGYTAAFVYGRAMRERGFIVASARVLRRAWQVYVAHIFLFVIYMAQIAYVSASFENPLYNEEMGVFEFLKQPDITLFQALLLKFKPANMDVLPLYIVLLAGFPPFIWLLIRSPSLALAASAGLYLANWHYDWNLPAYPDGTWAFNPFAWQLLFGFGAWCGMGGAQHISRFVHSRWMLVASIVYLALCFGVVMTWQFPRYGWLVPARIAEWMYPIDKANLDVLRFAHFLALAAVTIQLVRVDSPWLRSAWVKPAIVCGQHSLEIFCLGVFLAFAAHFAMVELSEGVLAQIVLSVAGIAIMIAVAMLISWYKRMDSKGSGPRSAPPNADFAGGEA